jgi:hypothetical protein
MRRNKLLGHQWLVKIDKAAELGGIDIPPTKVKGSTSPVRQHPTCAAACATLQVVAAAVSAQVKVQAALVTLVLRPKFREVYI